MSTTIRFSMLIGDRWLPLRLLGWFGPRGLTSIVLALVFLETEARFESRAIILDVVGLTVLTSLFFHEVGARPLVALYARRARRLGDDAPENRGAADEPPMISSREGGT